MWAVPIVDDLEDLWLKTDAGMIMLPSRKPIGPYIDLAWAADCDE